MDDVFDPSKERIVNRWEIILYGVICCEYFGSVCWNKGTIVSGMYITVVVPIGECYAGFSWPVFESTVIKNDAIVDTFLELFYSVYMSYQ